MTRFVIALVAGVAAVAAGCGAAEQHADPGEREPITVSGERPIERCVRPRADGVLVAREMGGFTPHSTLVVGADGFAWASAGPAFGGPRCYQLSADALAGLRSSLEAADLAALEPEYRGTTAGPDGMVVEITAATVTADGVSVYAESNADTPSRLGDLLDLLGKIEGAVVREG